MSKLEAAKDWLSRLLSDGAMSAPDVLRLAGEEGITERTLRRATADLDVVKRKVGAPGEDGQTWVWELASFGVDVGQRSDAFQLLSSLTLEDGRLWGSAAEQFQRADGAAVLNISPSAPKLHYLTRPRGASKTTDLAAIAIVVLLTQLPARGRAFAFAADMDQAALLLDAIAGFVARTEGLAGALRIDNYRVAATAGGARLDVMSSDSASAWGLKGDMFVVDEFAQWPTTPGPRRLWEAILSAVPKVAGCRLVLLSTAGDPAHPSHKLLGQAMASDQWRVSETPGPCPWIAPAALDEQRRLLSDSQYQRLHLNRWTASEDRLVDPEDLAACVRLDGPVDPVPGRAYRVGVDVGLRHDRTAIAVCHLDYGTDAPGAPPLVILDQLLAFAGSRQHEVLLDDVERAIAQVVDTYSGAMCDLDPWQAIGLAQRLRARGIPVVEYPFSQQSVGRLANTLHLLLKDRRLRLPDDAELLDELANVRLRETSPGVVRMDHDPGQHDDRAIALALACLPLVSQPAPGGSTGMASSRAVGRVLHGSLMAARRR